MLERRDPARKIARFFVLSIEPTLLGDAALVPEWGRLGTEDATVSICFAKAPLPTKHRRSWRPRSPLAAQDLVAELGSREMTGRGGYRAWGLL